MYNITKTVLPKLVVPSGESMDDPFGWTDVANSQNQYIIPAKEYDPYGGGDNNSTVYFAAKLKANTAYEFMEVNSGSSYDCATITVYNLSGQSLATSSQTWGDYGPVATPARYTPTEDIEVVMAVNPPYYSSSPVTVSISPRPEELPKKRMTQIESSPNSYDDFGSKLFHRSANGARLYGIQPNLIWIKDIPDSNDLLFYASLSHSNDAETGQSINISMSDQSPFEFDPYADNVVYNGIPQNSNRCSNFSYALYSSLGANFQLSFYLFLTSESKQSGHRVILNDICSLENGRLAIAGQTFDFAVPTTNHWHKIGIRCVDGASLLSIDGVYFGSKQTGAFNTSRIEISTSDTSYRMNMKLAHILIYKDPEKNYLEKYFIPYDFGIPDTSEGKNLPCFSMSKDNPRCGYGSWVVQEYYKDSFSPEPKYYGIYSVGGRTCQQVFYPDSLNQKSSIYFGNEFPYLRPDQSVVWYNARRKVTLTSYKVNFFYGETNDMNFLWKFKLSGSNDGYNWTMLDLFEIPPEDRNYYYMPQSSLLDWEKVPKTLSRTVANPGRYQYYRFEPLEFANNSSRRIYLTITE